MKHSFIVITRGTLPFYICTRSSSECRNWKSNRLTPTFKPRLVYIRSDTYFVEWYGRPDQQFPNFNWRPDLTYKREVATNRLWNCEIIITARFLLWYARLASWTTSRFLGMFATRENRFATEFWVVKHFGIWGLDDEWFDWLKVTIG